MKKPEQDSAIKIVRALARITSPGMAEGERLMSDVNYKGFGIDCAKIHARARKFLVKGKK